MAQAQKPSSSEAIDRATIVDANFVKFVQQEQLPEALSVSTPKDVGLDALAILDLFESQLISRHLDLLARELKRDNKAYYTIGSSGHEGMAAVAKVFRVNDIAFLHYRDAAFYIQRAKTKFTTDKIIRNLLLSFVAAKDDPIAAGRHKVLGSTELFMPPQISTIASHLPKAVGAAASIKRAQNLHIPHPLPDDGVVLCSFGDATVNHSTALGAFNSAQWLAHGHYPLPIVFICEDNGWGISTPTPEDWVELIYKQHPGLIYLKADGLNICDVYRAASEAEENVRHQKDPIFLHMKCKRLLGHAGTDFELQYREIADIEKTEAQDPLLHSARIILENKFLKNEEIIAKYNSVRNQVMEIAKTIVDSAQLDSAQAVMAAIIPPRRKINVPTLPSELQRQAIFGEKYKKLTVKNNLSQQLNLALTDLMLQYDNLIVFGEDVAQKGGVYRVTADLFKQFGPARVFNSLLDEQSILGYAIGHAHNGFMPMPEIQYLAYLHNAEDQLRGEAATLSFFSNGQLTNPMVIRIASLAYQKGFGGHFHNDNSIAVLRDIPGIIIACPSNGADAVKMLRTCVELAYVEQRVVVFLEPIVLYMTKDLHEPGDQAWLFSYPALEEKIPLGEIEVYGDSDEIVILTYANGLYMSLQVQKILAEQHNINIKVIDLRWLKPLNEQAILIEVRNVKHVLIVDEGRKTGSLSEQITTLLATQLENPPKITCLTGKDSFIPLGESWHYVLPSFNDIIHSVLT